MEKLVFNIDVKASREKIWKVLWDDETYRKWTSAFCGESYAESNWNEGDKIYFFGGSSGDGMNSLIETKIPNEYMAFKHIGEIKDFKEQPLNEETKKWSGAMETYRLIPDDEFTDLIARTDSVEKFVDYFKDVFPRGLEVVKQLSEEKK